MAASKFQRRSKRRRIKEDLELHFINPLQQEDILDQVFQYFDFEQFKEFRQVCFAWNRSSTRFMRKKCKLIHFKKRPNFNQYSFDDMRELLALVQNSFNFPCTKFTIDGDTVTKRDAKAIVKQFIRAIAPFVTHLQLSDGTTFTPPRSFLATQPPREEVEFSRLQNITVILQLQRPSYVADQRPGNILEYVGDIISNAPDLTTVRLNAPTDPRQLTSALSILERIDCSEIRTFSIHGNLEDDHLSKLLDLGMGRLKNLHIQIYYESEMSPLAFQGFLKYQSHTLQNLSVVCCYAMTRTIEVKLPRMPKLKTLSVDRRGVPPLYSSPRRLSFTEISYVRDLPNLNKIKFSDHFSWKLEVFFNESIQPIATVEELEFDASLVKSDVIEQADRIFPRLRKLTVPCLVAARNKIFYVPFSSVEELTLVYTRRGGNGDTVDTVLTGAHHSVCEWLLGRRRYRRNYVEFLQNHTAEPPLFLNRLKVLNIMTEYPGDRVAISELSVILMMMMRRLQCVKICEETARELTEPMIDWMRTSFEVQIGREKIEKNAYDVY